MSSRRAQVKFGETIGIVFIVYIVFVMGLSWYNSSNDKDFQEMFENDQREQSFEKYYFIVNHPFLHDSKRGIVQTTFDTVSLEAFEGYKETAVGENYLRDRLGDAEIVLEIYTRDYFEDLENVVFVGNPDYEDQDLEPIEIFNSQRDGFDDSGDFAPSEIETNRPVQYKKVELYNSVLLNPSQIRRWETFITVVPIEDTITGESFMGILRVRVPFR